MTPPAATPPAESTGPQFAGSSRPRWGRLAIGLLLVAAPVWVFTWAFGAVWHGHPVFPVTLFGCAAVGVLLLILAFRPRPDRSGERHRGWRMTGYVVGSVVAVVVAGGLIWLTPFTAGPGALAAMSSDAQVRVIDHPTSIELVPAGRTATTGLVFSPGARVDARAYVDVLRPQAEAGFLVVILKIPFGLGIVAPGQSSGPIGDHPEIARWAVGGHSLGGTSASIFAANNPQTVTGLLLYASYPLGNLSGTDLVVASISGSNDGLATPDDIEASRAKLPPSTVFTVVDGGVHAFFGDYGTQPGDGTPSISRDTATAEIAAATTTFLRKVAAQPS